MIMRTALLKISKLDTVPDKLKRADTQVSARKFVIRIDITTKHTNYGFCRINNLGMRYHIYQLP